VDEQKRNACLFAIISGLSEDDLTQPVSVWIKFDCHTKKGDLGVRWKSTAGEIDLALMEMTFGPSNPDHNIWQLQWKEITAFRSSFEDDELEMNIFNEAIGKCCQMPHIHLDVNCYQNSQDQLKLSICLQVTSKEPQVNLDRLRQRMVPWHPHDP
jgi:hypothetical protein